MSYLIRTEHYKTSTFNGSKVNVKREIRGEGNAWNHHIFYEDIYFIDLLNESDFNLVKELNLPNWYFDYTGKGMVLIQGKQEYVNKTIIKALNIKHPFIQ